MPLAKNSSRLLSAAVCVRILLLFDVGASTHDKLLHVKISRPERVAHAPLLRLRQESAEQHVLDSVMNEAREQMRTEEEKENQESPATENARQITNGNHTHAAATGLLPASVASKGLDVSSPHNSVLTKHAVDHPGPVVTYKNRPLATFPADAKMGAHYEASAAGQHERPMYGMERVGLKPMERENVQAFTQLGVMLWIIVSVFATMSCVSTLRGHMKERKQVSLLKQLIEVQNKRDLGLISEEVYRDRQQDILDLLNSKTVMSNNTPSGQGWLEEFEARRAEAEPTSTDFPIDVVEGHDESATVFSQDTAPASRSRFLQIVTSLWERVTDSITAIGLAMAAFFSAAGAVMAPFFGCSQRDGDGCEGGGDKTHNFTEETIADLLELCENDVNGEWGVKSVKKAGLRDQIQVDDCIIAIGGIAVADLSSQQRHDLLMTRVLDRPATCVLRRKDGTEHEVLLGCPRTLEASIENQVKQRAEHEISSTGGDCNHRWPDFQKQPSGFAPFRVELPETQGIVFDLSNECNNGDSLQAAGRHQQCSDAMSSEAKAMADHEEASVAMPVSATDAQHRPFPYNLWRAPTKQHHKTYGSTCEPEAGTQFRPATDESEVCLLQSNAWPHLPVPNTTPQVSGLNHGISNPFHCDCWPASSRHQNAYTQNCGLLWTRIQNDLREPAVRAVLALILLVGSICAAWALVPVALVKGVAALLSGLAAASMVSLFSNFMKHGVASDATCDSLVLAHDSSHEDDHYVGWLVSITAGCGAGQTRRVAAYDARCRTIFISRPWDCDPDATSRYVLYVDPWLNPISIFEYSSHQHEALAAPSLTRRDVEVSKRRRLDLAMPAPDRMNDYVNLIESSSGSSASVEKRRTQLRTGAERNSTPPAGPPDSNVRERIEGEKT